MAEKKYAADEKKESQTGQKNIKKCGIECENLTRALKALKITKRNPKICQKLC